MRGAHQGSDPWSGGKSSLTGQVSELLTPCSPLGTSCNLILFFWPHYVACGTLVSWPGIELALPALGVQSLSHWSTREVPLMAPFNLITSLKALSSNTVTYWGTRGSGVNIWLVVGGRQWSPLESCCNLWLFFLSVPWIDYILGCIKYFSLCQELSSLNLYILSSPEKPKFILEIMAKYYSLDF